MIIQDAPHQLPRSDAANAYDLLEDVKAAFLAEPLRADMGFVMYRGVTLDDIPYKQILKPACGAVGCVAGWSLALKGLTNPNERNGMATEEARDLLGLDSEEANYLFYPHSLMDRKDAQTPEYAAAVVGHITGFQQLYEAQLRAKAVE